MAHLPALVQELQLKVAELSRVWRYQRGNQNP